MAIPAYRRRYRLSVHKNSIDYATPYSEVVVSGVPCQVTLLLDTANVEQSSGPDVASIKAKVLVDLPFSGSAGLAARQKATVHTSAGALVGDFTISDVLNIGRRLVLLMDRFAE